MKFRAFIFAVLGLFVVVTAVAQVKRPQVGRPSGGGDVHHHHYYYGGGPGYAGGYGYSPRGFTGGLASSVGTNREQTSEAAENYAQTAHMVQENHNYAVNSYYANKETHDKYVEAHRQRLSPEQEQDMARRAEPGRLSNAQFDRTTNVINWPALLRDPEFTKERHTLDHLFHERTPESSGADSDNFVQITQTCDAMKKTLGEKLRKDNLPSVTFCAAEHFIKSLAYEGEFAVK